MPRNSIISARIALLLSAMLVFSTVKADEALTEPVLLGEQPAPAVAARQRQRAMRLLAFSPDGQALASVAASSDELIFRNPSTGAPLAAIPLQPNSSRAMAFSADGSRLIVAGDEVTVINVKTHLVISHWTANPPADGAAISADGKTAALGGGLIDPIIHRGIISIVDVASGHLLQKMEAHKQSVRQLAFSPDGRILASMTDLGTASDDSQIVLWDVGTGEEMHRFTRAAPLQHGLFFRWAESESKQIKGLSLHTWGNSLLIEGGSVENLAMPARTAIISGDCGPMLLDLASGQTKFTLLPPGIESISCTALSPDGQTIAAGDGAGGLAIWTIDRAKAQASGRLSPLRCELLMEHTGFLVGEPIVWGCRLTNVLSQSVPVYADSSNPNRSAISLHLFSLGSMRKAVRSPHGEALGAPRMLDPGASMELHFRSAGPDAVAGGAGYSIKLPELASFETAFVQYAPPPEASPLAGARIFSQPLRVIRSPGAVFSRPVFSQWMPSTDGAISARLHLDSALFGQNADVFIHGEIRNDSGHRLTISAPQSEVAASLTITGPAGQLQSNQKRRRQPILIPIEPKQTIFFFGPLSPTSFPDIMELGDYAVGYTYQSRAGIPDAPGDMWQGSITIPPIHFTRVLRLEDAPAATTQPAGLEMPVDPLRQ